MAITPEALFKYFTSLLEQPKIKEMIQRVKRKFHPVFSIVPTCGKWYGGMCNGAAKIEISSWVLKDAKVARGVGRHELAHAIQDHLDIEGRSHGKEFIQILKTIAPRRWRKDRYWENTPAIKKARVKIYPAKGKVMKPLVDFSEFKVYFT